MNPVLIILHCREIPECLDSYKKLPIDKAYLTAFWENEWAEAITNFINATKYSDYLVISDDVIAEPTALQKVLIGLEKHRVVTGYCNIHRDTPDIVNTGIKSLTNSRPLSASDYPFISRQEADNNINEYFSVSFLGLVFTGMRKQMWLDYPLHAYPDGMGWGSDYFLSYRLQTDGYNMYAVRGAFSQHLGGNLLLKPTLMGKIEKHIKLIPQNSKPRVFALEEVLP